MALNLLSPLSRGRGTGVQSTCRKSGVSHVRRKVLQTSSAQQSVITKQLQHICSVCCVTRDIMLSLAIFTFFFDRFCSCTGRPGMASVVDCTTCRASLYRQRNLPSWSTPRRIRSDEYTAFVFNLGQVWQIFVAISQPDQTNTEIESSNRLRLKLIHIVRSIESFRTA
jgi:hypothetical protein